LHIIHFYNSESKWALVAEFIILMYAPALDVVAVLLPTWMKNDSGVVLTEGTPFAAAATATCVYPKSLFVPETLKVGEERIVFDSLPCPKNVLLEVNPEAST